MFETKDLYYTVTLAEYGNISKAAQKLFLTQPALTKFIQRHEEALGEKIFLKSGYNLVLTEYGKHYVKYASKILEELNTMEEELKNFKSNFRIAIGLSAGNYFLPEVLPQFYDIYPDIKIEVLQGNSLNFPALVKNGTVDVALSGMCNIDSTLESISLKKGEVLLAVSKNHPLAKEENTYKDGFNHPWIDIQRFQDYGFIMCQKDQWPAAAAEKIFRNTGIMPKKLFHMSNYQMSVQLAMTTHYAAFVDEATTYFTPDANNLKFFSVGKEPVYYETLIIYLKDTPFLPYIQNLACLLKKYISKTQNQFID